MPTIEDIIKLIQKKEWVLDFLDIESIKQRYCLAQQTSQVKIAVLDTGISNDNDTNAYFQNTETCHLDIDTPEAKSVWDMLKNEPWKDILEKLPEEEGYPFQDCTRSNSIGHGTHMTSLISGKAGISNNAKIISIKAQSMIPEQVSFGIFLAISLGVNIVNLSIATRCTENLHKAVKAAFFKNCILVCAAGNSLEDETDSIEFPAAFQRTFAIGGYEYNSEKKEIVHQINGDRGRLLDFMCPSVGVPELIGNEIMTSGTSIACAIFSGIVALFIEIYTLKHNKPPTYREIKTTMALSAVHPTEETPNTLDEEHDGDWGYGIIHPKYLFELFDKL